MSFRSYPVISLCVAMCCFAAPEAIGGQPIASVSQAGENRIETLWTQSALTGEWGGFRPALAEKGIEFTGSYTGTVLGLVSGGLRRDVVYNGWLVLAMEASVEKLIGWNGAKFHVSTVDTHGEAISDRYVGDIGGISGYDAYDSFRLYQLWLEQNAWDDRVSLRVGLMSFEEEFFITERSAFFVGSGYTSVVTLWTNMPFPTAPDSALGIRLRVEPAPGWYVMAAVFDGNPSAGNYPDSTPGALGSSEFNHWNTHISLHPDEGVLCIGEIGWSVNRPPGTDEGSGDSSKQAKSMFGERGLAGEYKLGVVFHSDTFSDTYDVTLDQLGSSLAPAELRRGGRDYALYASIDQELWREPGSEDEGLGAFFRGIWQPRNRNFIEYSLVGGLTYKGLLNGRGDDSLGLGFVYYSISDQVAAATHNTNSADHVSRSRPDFEAGIECTYCCQVTKWLSVQPEVQYIIKPGATGETDNALVIGLLANVTF